MTMVYEPLYHAQEIWQGHASGGTENVTKSARFSDFSWLFLMKQIFHSRWLDRSGYSQLSAAYARFIGYLSPRPMRASGIIVM